MEHLLAVREDPVKSIKRLKVVKKMEAEVYYHLIKYDKMNISKSNTRENIYLSYAAQSMVTVTPIVQL